MSLSTSTQSLNFSFPYKTRIEHYPLLGLNVECLHSLDETIDSFFLEYERTGRTELFEDHCPYFGNAWPSGVALANWIQSNLSLFKGKSVLEVGCGLAIPSLFLSKNAIAVTATDLHPDVAPFLQKNVARNNCRDLKFSVIDWRASAETMAFDCIVGSDLVYDRQTPEQLLKFLEAFLVGEKFAVIADPGRSYWEVFLRLGRAKNFTLTEFLFDGIFFAKISQ